MKTINLTLLGLLGLSLISCQNSNASSSNLSSSSRLSSNSEQQVDNSYLGLGYKCSFDNVSQLCITSSLTSFNEKGQIMTNSMERLALNLKGDSIKNSLSLEEYVDNQETYEKQINDFSLWSINKTIKEIKDYVITSNATSYLKENTIKDFTMPVNDLIASLEVSFKQKEVIDHNLNNIHSGLSLKGFIENNDNLKPTNILNVALVGTLYKDNKVMTSLIDELTFDFKIDANNVLSLNSASQFYDENNLVKSSKELKDNYVYSENPSSLKWYQQAKVLEQAVRNKNSEEILALDPNSETFKNLTIPKDIYLKEIANLIK